MWQCGWIKFATECTASILKWLYSKNLLRVFKFSISLLVPSDFERKKISEINSLFSCSVYYITPFRTSLLISTIIFCDAWSLITLVIWLGGSCSKSNVNPLTVFGISLSDVIFSHSWFLLEIEPPLKPLIFFLDMSLILAISNKSA